MVGVVLARGIGDRVEGRVANIQGRGAEPGMEWRREGELGAKLEETPREVDVRGAGSDWGTEQELERCRDLTKLQP